MILRSLDKKYNAIEKCLQILSIFSLDKTQFSINEICEKLDFNISTTYRILSTLEEYGYVSRLKNKDYVFAHGAKYQLPDKKILIGCYHPSPRNVNTKRINLSKMVRLFKNAKKIII